jgi:hypothetical protein
MNAQPAEVKIPEVRLRLRHGVCRQLEDVATALITESLRGVTSRSAKSDILTPWKEEDRATREILTSTGVADPSVRRGMFRRAWNPRQSHLNSRDGHYPSRRIPDSPDLASVDGEYADD